MLLTTLTLALLWSPAFAASPASPEASDSAIRIVLVFDGPGRLNGDIEALVEDEIDALVDGELEVRYLPSVDGGWTHDGIAAALDEIYATGDADLVVTFGLLASHEACLRPSPPVPTVAATVLDPELQSLPATVDGTSGIPNLVYIQMPQTLEEEVRAFHRVVPFRKLALVGHRALVDGVPGLASEVGTTLSALGLKSQFIKLESSADALFDALDSDVDAVFVWPQLQLSATEFRRMVDGLNDRALPSFSSLGRPEVDAGMLAGLRSADLLPRLARRTALNVQRILLGEPAADIPVAISFRSSLSVNLATAEALGVAPRWETLIEATLVDADKARTGDPLHLTQAVAEAVRSNLDLEVRRRQVAADHRDLNLARADWRPRLDLSLTALQVDSDRAEASFGSQPERELTASLSATQLIFSEPARANVDAQEFLVESRNAALESARLDIALEAAVTYLNLLRAQTFQRIQRNNLDLTRSNLELAEARRQAGSSGAAEIYRWESRIAQDRQSLLDAAADVKVAELALNRLLHRDLEEPVHTVEVGLDDRDLLVDMEDFQGFIATPRHFHLLRDFTVEQGIARSPDLLALRRQVEVRERLARAASRAFYLPTVAAQASLERLLADGGAGTGGGTLFPGLPTADDTSWSLALNAALPIYSGGARLAEKLQAEERLAQAQLELEAAEEQVAEAIRGASIRARTSFFRINLAEESATAARNALDLVSDAYARGAVSILDLLDSQNAALNADLAAADAVYDFFIDLLRLERTIGSIYLLESLERRNSWMDELNDYFMAAGAVPWTPSPLDP